MKKTDLFNDIAAKLCEALPDSVLTLKKDLEKNFQTVLRNAFNKLDLVTREEFDAQTKVLARTRKKIDELATQIEILAKKRGKKGEE